MIGSRHRRLAQLESGALSPKEVTVEMAALRHSASVMVDITNDLLDLEALRAGRLRVAPEATDVRSLVSACVAYAVRRRRSGRRSGRTRAPDAQMRGACVELTTAADVPDELWVDPLRLRQVRPQRISAVPPRPMHCITLPPSTSFSACHAY